MKKRTLGESDGGMTEVNLDEAADFLEEYALRPPRAELHHPPADSKRWREIQITLRDLARRLRRAADGEPVDFTETDVQFLETQSSRLRRMHHWIRTGISQEPDTRGVASVAGVAAERLEVLAAIVRARIGRIGRPSGQP